jgi:putative phosphonate metabolism protein
MSERFALYFAPAHASPWWRFGAYWIGRDEVRDAALPQQPPPGFDAARFAALTAEPRRYGLHATLKAPLRLREGANEALLRQRLADVAARLRALPLGPLAPVWMDGFIALVPQRCDPALTALAAECVTGLDALRAPLTAQDLARRNPQALDERGRQLLAEYGYPHVLERFRFHMTLTGPVDGDTAGRLLAHLTPRVNDLNAAHPLALDRLCLFCEARPGAAFVRVHEQALA